MNNNKLALLLTLLGFILIIIIPVLFNINKDYKNKLYNSTVDKIIIGAKKCYLEEKCTNDSVTLKVLYQYKYLDKVINPINKEYFNEDSVIINKDGVYTFQNKNNGK